MEEGDSFAAWVNEARKSKYGSLWMPEKVQRFQEAVRVSSALSCSRRRKEKIETLCSQKLKSRPRFLTRFLLQLSSFHHILPKMAAASYTSPAASSFADATLNVAQYVFEMPTGTYSLFTKAEAIGTPTRQPVLLLAIIDNSGSMGASAGVIPGSEDHGFNRLDLVKHAVRTMAALLGPEDSLGIVSFSTNARIVMQPRRMDPAGLSAVVTALESVNPDASTNIWDGLRKAAEMASLPAYTGCHIAAMLLTDGYPNLEPPRGTLATLKAGALPLANPWTLHTFGFGYDLDSALCAQIAEWGGGTFGFIPDATMVGTVFINALAYILATAHKGAVLEAHGATIKTGAVGWQQPRTFVTPYTPLPLEPDEPQDPSAGSTATAVPATVLPTGLSLIRLNDDTEAAFAFFRHQYIEILDKVIAVCDSSGEAGVLAAQEILANFEVASQPLAVVHPHIAAVLRDIRSSKEGEGQVGMAPSYWRRWGRHYLRAYKRAQELQQCMNFKDPGLQIYGGDLFHSLQDAGDKAFITLPPPKPSMVRHETAATASHISIPITSMGIFHNASSGCFAPGTLIAMADGTRQPIESLLPGQRVWTPDGPSVIRAMVTCGSANRHQPMTRVGALWITPWHPIRVRNEWKFPADLLGYSERLMPTVYNLVLQSGHIVDASGIHAVTLAHGFNESVVAHPFFGTDAVLADLSQAPGWEQGLPVFRNLRTTRDPVSGTITGWIDDM